MSNQLDDIFADLTETVAPAVKAVAPEAPDRAAAVEQLTQETHDKPRYKTVDKVTVDGGPNQTITRVYPSGYLNIKQEGWRFNNHLCLWMDQLLEWAEFFRDTQRSDAFIASLRAAGAKRRGEG